MQDKLLITCLFKNDAEESIFINQQSRLNYDLNIIESKTYTTWENYKN